MYDAEFVAPVQHLKNEFAKLQTGRATPALVEDLMVEAYGSTQPLKGLASVSIPEATSLVISPWDKSVLNAIVKAIHNSPLGINPSNDGIVVRLNLPPLTEERRRDLTKVVDQYKEEAKIAVRNIRQELMKKVKSQEDNKEISEDDRLAAEKKIQAAVDKVNQEIDDVSAKKSHDIMSI